MKASWNREAWGSNGSGHTPKASPTDYDLTIAPPLISTGFADNCTLAEITDSRLPLLVKVTVVSSGPFRHPLHQVWTTFWEIRASLLTEPDLRFATFDRNVLHCKLDFVRPKPLV
jgi:hypothetical protein